ncbi:hypothetical protein ACHHYP_09111 [Achlya hypogyna]|uniref:Ion transport domain-containing protein n=1 Tax=Achlya hypogyna TaxID=1202772 RepID=A0A1V9YNN6_ACHHY|nr:hypothetical protein ACHHYP_09111 [Achlya hypogyna]
MDAELNELSEAEILRRASASDDVLNYQSAATKQTLLHLAAGRGFAMLATTLVQKQVNLNVQDFNGKTAIMVAVETGNVVICRLLIAANADLSLKSHDGHTAFYLAARTDQRSAALLMLPKLKDEGAHELFDAIAQQSPDDLRLLLDAGLSPALTRPDVSQSPALHVVIDNVDLLRVFLEKDASLVNLKDRHGRTALALAATLGHSESCQLLLKFGASLDTKDNRGRSAVHLAACHEQEDVLRLFMAEAPLSFSINAKDDEHRTPLHVLAERGNVRGCALLCKLHAKLNATDVFGSTPMHLAASYGFAELCLLFVRVGALALDCHDAAVCRPGASPHGWAAVSHNRLCTIYSELIDLGVPQTLAKYGTLRIRDLEMNTLLHVAAQHASPLQADYLLHALARLGRIPVDVHNCHGQSPLQLSDQRLLNAAVLRSLGSRDDASFRRGASQGTASDAFAVVESLQLLRVLSEIGEGYGYLGEPSTLCVSDDDGDTVLHALLDSFKEKSPFPTTAAQEELLGSANWLGSPSDGIKLILDKKVSRPLPPLPHVAQNWRGETPLHKAAAMGALGFCRELVRRGASAAVESGPLDARLRDPAGVGTDGWTALNFCVDGAAPAPLVLFLLDQPQALPTTSPAVTQLKKAMATKYPALLPTLQRRLDDESRADPLLTAATARCREFFHGVPDTSAVLVFKIVLETEAHGVAVLKKYAADDCVVRATGDTLLHIFAADTQRDRLPELTYLASQMPVDTPNKRRKTALHYACEHRVVPVVRFLLDRHADLRASCYSPSPSLQLPALGIPKGDPLEATAASDPDATDELWSTPLHLCLRQPLAQLSPKELQANNTIVELLLQRPDALAEPSPMPQSALAAWNAFVFGRLVTDFPFALPKYLDHFVEAKAWYGTTMYSFREVKHVCRNLHRLSEVAPAMLHPAVRNALRAKWTLFGRRIYRKELVLSVLLLVCFTISNYTLVAEDSAASRGGWFPLDTPANVATGVFKVLTWLLALYHLVFVEVWQEWRMNAATYWRSLWNYINLAAYALLLLSIPMDALRVPLAVKESCLSVASLLLLFGLFQGLLVFSYFSVLLFTFSRMLKVALKFCLLQLILLVGFTAAFYLVYHGAPGHTSLGASFATVFFLTFGEINFRDAYAATNNPYRYSAGLCIVVVYLVCVNVVGLNMLIAMMTSEYESIKSQAEVLAVQELARTLQRYESWLGAAALETLYESRALDAFATYEVKTDRGAPVRPLAADDQAAPAPETPVALERFMEELSRVGARLDAAVEVSATLALLVTEIKDARDASKATADEYHGKVLRLEQLMTEHVLTQSTQQQAIMALLQRRDNYRNMEDRNLE